MKLAQSATAAKVGRERTGDEVTLVPPYKVLATDEEAVQDAIDFIFGSSRTSNRSGT